MRRDGRAQRGWERRGSDAHKQPRVIVEQLARRVLCDLERCRRVWLEAQDPLALCEGVRLANLPSWLSDALLMMLTDAAGDFPSIQRKLWKARRQQAEDAYRAAAFGVLRAHPEWPKEQRPTRQVAEQFAIGLRYTERLADAGIEPSVGSRGDSYDNALAESIIGLFKTEVIHRRGPWRNLDAVEYATLEWVDWFNHRRLLEPIGNVPPAELELKYDRQQNELAIAA